MKNYIYVLMIGATLVTGCGVDNSDNANKPLDVLNGSHVSDGVIYSVIDYVNEVAPAHVNTDNYTLTVHGTVEESMEACGGEGEVGCHNKGLKYIHTPWPSEYEDYDAATLNAISAYTLCHELGHLYYYNTTGNSDHNHTHTEWFDGNKVDSVCGKVYDKYNKTTLE